MATQDTRQSRAADAIFAIAMIAVSLVTIFEARKQPRSPYDPIGAAAIPIWTGWITIGLAALLLLRIALRKSTLGGAQSLFVGIVEQDTLDYRLWPGLAVTSFVLTIAYAAAIPLIGFRIATFGFMLALGWLMCDRRPVSLIGTAIVAAGGSVAIDYVFRSLLLVDLP
jgi:hypothetical protein